MTAAPLLRAGITTSSFIPGRWCVLLPASVQLLTTFQLPPATLFQFTVAGTVRSSSTSNHGLRVSSGYRVPDRATPRVGEPVQHLAERFSSRSEHGGNLPRIPKSVLGSPVSPRKGQPGGYRRGVPSSGRDVRGSGARRPPRAHAPLRGYIKPMNSEAACSSPGDCDHKSAGVVPVGRVPCRPRTRGQYPLAKLARRPCHRGAASSLSWVAPDTPRVPGRAAPRPPFNPLAASSSAAETPRARARFPNTTSIRCCVATLTDPVGRPRTRVRPAGPPFR